MQHKISSIILLHIILSFTMVPSITASDTTTIYVDPATIILHCTHIGKNFTVNITITEVYDLCGWEFKLCYNNTLLSCINATEGPFLKTGGNTYFIPSINNAYNVTHGQAHVSCTLIGMGPGVNGNGVLATVGFQVKAVGDTLLHLKGTKLLDSALPDPNPIDHSTIDGTIIVKPPGDVAVTNVILSKTIVGQRYSVSINVTVENQGNDAESVNVTLYADKNITAIQDEITIGNETVLSLTNGTSTVITFTWNTTSFAYGNYTIKAIADTVPGETDTADNTYINGSVVVTIAGDIDGSGKVDLADLFLFGKAWWGEPGDPNWNPNADLDDSGKVDYDDLFIFGKHWWQSC